jgi:hypothetical protein
MNLQNQLNPQNFDHYTCNEFYKHLIHLHIVRIKVIEFFEPII